MSQTPDDWTETEWREWELAQLEARFPDKGERPTPEADE